VLGLIGSGHFRGGVAEIAGPLVENLTHSDPFLVLADYGAYVACQGPVSAAWSDQERWTRIVHPEHRRLRQVLVVSRHPGVLRRHLGPEARTG